jgi:hypothetical protein
MKKKYFRLYACCIPVKGYNRSMITDIQRKDSVFIPNILLDILDMSEMLSISEIKRKFSRQKHSYINEYFTFLIEKDLGFYCEKFEIDEYPKLNLEWKRPEKITNAIIDSDKHIYITKKVIKQLDEVDCKALQIRFYQSLRLNKLYSVINLFGDSRLRHIDMGADLI